MTLRSGVRAALANYRRPALRPFPSLLLVVRSAGLAIADPRAHDVIDVAIEDVEALMVLGAASYGPECRVRPDQSLIARLTALDLLIDWDDPAQAPAIESSELVGLEDERECTLIEIVTPSVIRLHEGRPLAWDRGSGVYRDLRSSHLRVLWGLIHQVEGATTPARELELSELRSVGLVRMVEPESDSIRSI